MYDSLPTGGRGFCARPRTKVNQLDDPVAFERYVTVSEECGSNPKRYGRSNSSTFSA
jgi:hypothetical protein